MAGGEATGRTAGHARNVLGATDGLARQAATLPHRSAALKRDRLLPLISISTGDGTRSYPVHPALWIGGSLIAVCLMLGTISAGLYMAFRDDILEYAVRRPIYIEQAYEDRIAALRSEIDRVNSRQLLDQDAFEAKIGQLMSRQDDLRAEEARVAGLLTSARSQNIHVTNQIDASGSTGQLGSDLFVPAAGAPEGGLRQPARAPADRSLPLSIEDQPQHSSWLFGTDGSIPSTAATVHPSPGVRLARIEADLDSLKSAETASIAQVAGLAETHSRAIETVVGQLGLRLAEPDRPPVPKSRATDVASRKIDASAKAGVGGPLVPILDEGEILTRAELALARLNQLKQGINLLPLGRPILSQTEVTSPFGERQDPFLGVMAMHTGIDLRAAFGDPVIATGAGIVSEASRQGGYGNMVEIDHGNGLTTRYGHLSQFAVVVGEKVKAGQILGYVGSTGRSTAPHLHYETRVSGVAVNPESYLQAGNQLRPLLN